MHSVTWQQPDAALWALPAALPVLAEGSLDLWLFSQTQPPAVEQRLWPLLSAEEQARALHFATPALRARYTVRRAVLRRMLSHYSEFPATALPFEFGPRGKPALPAALLHFNLSHSGDLALLGIWRDGPLGVDIEALQAIPDMASVARYHFSALEQAEWFSLGPDQQVAAFYRCWTRKEALIKADGSGLSIPLTAFDVSLLPGEAARLRRLDVAHIAELPWLLHDAAAVPGYQTALCCASPLRRLRHWQVPAHLALASPPAQR